MAEPMLIVHGGAGSLRGREPSDPEVRAQAEALLSICDRIEPELRAGSISALDAVERAVAALEDDARFNAGTGSALCADGTVEMSAAIMSGADLSAGAVACVRETRNPVSLARALAL